MITLDVTGKLTYGTSVYPTTSACIETLQGGAKQFVLHTAKGHLDFRSDKISVSGISPLNGTTIVKANAQDSSGDDDNTTTGDGSGVTFPNGTKVSNTSLLTHTAMPANAAWEIITLIDTNGARVDIYDYIDHIAVAMIDRGFSVTTKADYSRCAISTASNITAYYPSCESLGVNYDRTAGTISFTNAPMKPTYGTCPGECLANGSLSNLNSTNSNDETNTTTGGETGKGITLSKSIGGISTLASTLAANPAKGKAEWGNALESIYVYMINSGGILTIGMAKVGSATLSTWVNNTSAGVCTLEESSLSKYYKLCSSLGIDYNQTAGTVTFNNTEMIDKVGPHGTFTVSGSLSFKPN